MKNFFYLALLFLGLAFISCGDDGPDVDCDDENAVVEFYNGLLSEYSNKLNGLDPTSSSYCQDAKDAINEYLDDVEGLEDCFTGSNLTTYKEGLANARSNLDDLTC